MGFRHMLMAAMVLAFGGVLMAQDGAQRVRIVAFGDSTTASRGTLAVYAMVLEKELPARGIEAEVINAGIGGNTTAMARNRFQRDVLEHKPDLVIIQFGINDAAVDVWKDPPATEPRVSLEKYRANLEYFVDTLRAANTKVLLMTPNPMRWKAHLRERYGKPPYLPEDPDGFNVVLKTYAEAVRKIAREKQVELVDVYAQYEAYNEQEGQEMDSLLLDGMHPNAAGQRLAADLLLEKIPAMLKGR